MNNIDLKQKYLKKHLFNYLGNKRSLLGGINNAIINIKKQLNKETLTSKLKSKNVEASI